MNSARPFVRLLPFHWKSLYCNLLETGHELDLQGNRIVILAGQLRGLCLAFTEDDSCCVSSDAFQLEIEGGKGLSLQGLICLLLRHNIIKKC